MKNMFAAIVLMAIAAPAVARAQDAAASEAQTYMAFQVEKEARVKTPVKPDYPAELFAARTKGDVLVQYIVAENGTASIETFKVLRSNHAQFSEAVRRAVARMTFHPAEVEGKRVKQLVQQQFKFER